MFENCQNKALSTAILCLTSCMCVCECHQEDWHVWQKCILVPSQPFSALNGLRANRHGCVLRIKLTSVANQYFYCLNIDITITQSLPKEILAPFFLFSG